MAMVHTARCASTQMRALCHDHFQQGLSSSRPSVHIRITSLPKFLKFSARPQGLVPSSGITRCIFLGKHAKTSSSSSWELWRAGFRARRMCVAAAAAQPPEGSAQTFREEDYEEKEETEEEARTRNWVERGWAPWEENLSPEAQFAVESLAPGEEEPVVSWESFEKLNPKWQKQRKKTLQEEEEKKEKEKVKPNLEGSLWDQPLVFTLIPPRDWPPPGWHVDPKELAYIRESQALEDFVATPEVLAAAAKEEMDEEKFDPDFPRWKMFLNQYIEWVAANRDRLDEESQEVDAEYYPGRRRIGENAATDGDMPLYELPFIYPGQHYWGIVSHVSLYEGAFVFFGGVHDGWVPILDNDWYYIRNHIKVGMRVQVEVLAKRDPYRFRFPIEMRFVDPNIDHMIFRRFEYPPIFGRPGDNELDEVARDSGRPYWPKPRVTKSPEDEDEDGLAVHPAIPRLWQIHQAEQMVLDEEEGGDDDLDDDIASYMDDEDDDDDEEYDVEEMTFDGEEETFVPQWFEGGSGEYDIPTLVLNTDPKWLNLEAARAERQEIARLSEEADARGEEFEPPMLRFEKRVELLNQMHNQRRMEQDEALLRDTAYRKELGLPVEEPGRYADKEFWGKNPYDPNDPRWRHDYWGDPSKIKEDIRRDREPRVARVDETAVVEDVEDEDLAAKEEEEEVEVEEVTGDVASPSPAPAPAPAPAQAQARKAKQDSGVVNGTATVAMDDVRTMFAMQPEDDIVAPDDIDDLEEEDGGNVDEDIAEGGGIDMPDTNR